MSIKVTINDNYFFYNKNTRATLATKINKNQWLSFVFALMKCSKAAFGEQNKKCFYSGSGILHAVGGG